MGIERRPMTIGPKHAAWMWVGTVKRRDLRVHPIGELILQLEGEFTIQEKLAWVRRFQCDSCATMAIKEQ